MLLKFSITARNTGDVLARVVMLFHRSAVEIDSIDMPARRKKKSNLKITITVDGQHRNARRMAAILERVVDVVCVEMQQSGAGSTCEQRERVRGIRIG